VRQGLHRVDHALRFLESKTDRSRRSVPLPGLCADAPADHAKRQEAERDGARVWTTGSSSSPQSGRRPIRATSPGSSPGGVSQQRCRVVRMHDQRHTRVTLLLSLGVPPRVVMEIIGHSAPEMTMNVHGHVALDDQRKAVDRLDGLLDDE
jgi:integrase